jgi:hypothetical protein
MRRLAAAAAVAAAVFWVAPAVAGDSAKVRVSPHRGGPAKVFVVGFTAPQPSGHRGVVDRSYTVSAARHSRAGCTWSVFGEATASAAGERVRVRLKPSSHWCRGRFKGRVTMNEGPYCQAGQPCPAGAAGTRPCPETSGAYGCGCCPPPPQSDRPVKCPEATAGDCCGASDCSPPPPSFPSRSVVLGRFSFRVR